MVDNYLNSFSRLDCLLMGSVGILLLYQLYFYIRYMAAVMRHNKRVRKVSSSTTQADDMPGVSVIVSAHNEEVNLNNYLYALLEQDYPSFEVIVVNDGSEDATPLVLEKYRSQYPKLHITFVPHEARVMSTKKLALTLAVKAANYEYLLFTDADCIPESRHWIREMALGMKASNTKQVVLGYSPYFFSHDMVNRIIRYETLFNGLHYMGRALTGRPYMGVGRNLMYSKELFLTHNGFSGMLTLKSGDDDLFVNKVATHRNTTVVCNPDALIWSLPKTTFDEWIRQKRRHLYTSKYYKHSSRFVLGWESIMRGLWYVALILAFSLGSMEVIAITALCMLIRLLTRWHIINHAARFLGEKAFGLEILWYDIALPLLTAFLLMTQPKNQNKRW